MYVFLFSFDFVQFCSVDVTKKKEEKKRKEKKYSDNVCVYLYLFYGCFFLFMIELQRIKKNLIF
jgi:hypothetical protein